MSELVQISNFPDYFIDKEGNAYSKKKSVRHDGGKSAPVNPRKLNPVIDHYGYRVVTLAKDGNYFKRKVGRLVLEAFVGPAPKGYLCCHGAMGKLNDSLENLSWGTPSKNNGEDRKRDGTLPWGETSPTSKLTETDVQAIRALRGVTTQQATADAYGISQSHVSELQSGKYWPYLQ